MFAFFAVALRLLLALVFGLPDLKARSDSFGLRAAGGGPALFAPGIGRAVLFAEGRSCGGRFVAGRLVASRPAAERFFG